VRQMSDEHVAMGYLIEDHLESLKKEWRSPHTIAARKNILNRLHEFLPFGVAYATTEQIQAFMAAQAWGRWARSTGDNHIRKFFQWATENGHLDGNPWSAVGRPKTPRLVPKPVTEADLARALQAPEPIRTAVLLAAWEGMRVSEIAACEREHITQDTVFIPDGKGGVPGTVPTHPIVWEELSRRPPGRLILNRDGLEVSGHWISQTARYHFNRMGLEHVHMHRFRHRFGTKIQELQGDIRVTQECMRHANVGSTQGYTLVAGEQRRSAVGALPGVGLSQSLPG
jgi:integrase/recombinase XerD